MSTKLSNINTQYRRFSKNQVLTADHLNEVVDFFDDQDRLSRIHLSGVGIVCGFKVFCNSQTSVISITQGKGITTDGDLFQLYEIDPKTKNTVANSSIKTFTHYKKYNNKKANYTPYFYENSKQLEIFELLSEKQSKKEKDPVTDLKDFDKTEDFNLKDAVLLLYLEEYESDSDLCKSLSCDNQGIEVITNYKVLLVSKQVASKINSNDRIIKKTSYSKLYFELPDVFINRIVIHPEDFANYKLLKKQFAKGIFKNNVVEKVKEAYTTLFEKLKMPLFANEMKARIDHLFRFTAEDVPGDFQYRYDLLKDLADTYNEIKSLFFEFEESFCFVDINSFPKHLMLGTTEKKNKYSQFRHSFYKSPLLTDQENKTPSYGKESSVYESNKSIPYSGKNNLKQHIYSLIGRSFQLIKEYNPNYNFIKITPSFELGILSKKAIPFYLNVDEQLVKLWNYTKTIQGKYRNNISYHNSFLNIKRPLEVALDHNFYKIEGHQGQNYDDALRIIQGIRKKNGLGFNVIALKIRGTQQARVDEVIKNYTTFYLNRNHGYEHKQGVAPGGTFIMIYVEGIHDPYYYNGYGYPYDYGDNYEDSKPSLAGDFDISRKIKLSKKEILKSNITTVAATPDRTISGAASTSAVGTATNANAATPDHTVSGNSNSTNTNTSVTTATSTNAATPDLVVAGGSAGNISANEPQPVIPVGKVLNPVIADFSLPYMCCDENRIVLKLPTKELCFDENTKPLTFLVKPTAGYVEADVEVGLDGGVSFNTLGEFVFDPTIVSKSLYGKPIKFTVNNIKTQCVITVKPKPVFDFMVETIGAPLNNTVVVNFKITGADLIDGLEYTWNFGDGSTPLVSKDLNISHPFVLSRELEAVFGVSLSAGKGTCTTVVNQKVRLGKPQATVIIDDLTVCRHDTESHVFDIKPKGQIVNLSGEGISQNGVGDWVFNATGILATTKNIAVLVNGVASGAIVTIKEKPAFDFQVKTIGAPINNSVKIDFEIFGNALESGIEYTWDFGDGSTLFKSTSLEASHTYNLERRARTYGVTVTAGTGPCSHSIVKKTPIQANSQETVEVTFEKEFVCRNDNKEHAFRIIPENGIVNLSGEGISLNNTGKWVFTGSNVALPTTSVTVHINGVPSTIIIPIREGAIANFTHEVKDDFLVLTNTSQHANSYKWSFLGKVLERAKRSQVKIPLNDIDGSIEVSLEAINSTCGSATETALIKIEKEDNCSLIVSTFIDNLFEKKTISNLEEKLSRSAKSDMEVITFIEELKTLLSKIKQDKTGFISGGRNNELDSLFQENIFNSIISILKKIGAEQDKKLINQLTEIYIKLFYSILRCQEKSLLEEFSTTIELVLNRIKSFLSSLKESKINIDDDGTLKTFLTEIKQALNTVIYINKAITIQEAQLDFNVSRQ